MSFVKSLVAGAATAILLACVAPATASQKVVTVAYQLTISPWISRLADGTFEKETGYQINWRQFSTGAEIISAMASGAVDISVLGSSPIAVAASAGVDVKTFWILEDIAHAEALFVRSDSGIESKEDLIGKKLAVPVASTSHYQLMFALREWGIEDKVTVLNMNPDQAAAAWERKDIDGAFIWGAALQRIKKDGRPFITSGEICKMGRCTFEAMTTTSAFAKDNSEFLTKFTQIADRANEDYKNNSEKWQSGTENVKLIVELFGADESTVIEDLSQYRYPTRPEQATCQWLGCGAEGGVAKTLLLTAEFLKGQGRIDKVLTEYSHAVTDEYVSD